MRSEFDVIDGIRRKFGLDHLGDDCAVLPKDGQTDQLITADLLIEHIDFRRDWTTPEMLGHKALAVSLSDIAGMGGTPVWALITLGIPVEIWESDFLDRFYNGWHGLAGQFGIVMVGGDLSRSPDALVIDSIVAGELPRGTAIHRSGAEPGDLVCVTGTVGGAAGGLRLLEKGYRFAGDGSRQDHLIAKQLIPVPQVTIGKQLSSLRLASACVDISDGLAADLHHICEASGVGAKIHSELIPIDPDLAEIDADDSLSLALSGGEDFELLFTVSPDKEAIARDLADITVIGEITDLAGGIEILRSGRSEPLEPAGFRHF